MSDNPIFILGAHKSGTTLLRSIFDAHPDLFVVPFETHFFQNQCFWVDYNYRQEHPRSLSAEEIVARFSDRLHHLNKTEDRLGDTPESFTIDVSAFQETFKALDLTMNQKQRFGLLMNAYHQALHGTPLPEDKQVVEKSVEHAEFAPFLKQMFPKARFVHIVRNPYANIVSLRKAKILQSGFPLVFRILNSLYNSYYHLYRNQKLINSYHTLRYEDLVTDPEKEISKLTDFLDLRFHDILLQPTKFGNIWQGNSSTGRDLVGFDQARLASWEETIGPMEIMFLNRLFDYPFEEYGYEKLPDPSFTDFLKPVKEEGLTRYLLNRLYLAYLSYDPGKQI